MSRKHNEKIKILILLAKTLCTACLLCLLVPNLYMHQKTARCISITHSFVFPRLIVWKKHESDAQQTINIIMYHEDEAIISLEYNPLATKLWRPFIMQHGCVSWLQYLLLVSQINLFFSLAFYEKVLVCDCSMHVIYYHKITLTKKQNASFVTTELDFFFLRAELLRVTTMKNLARDKT